MKTRCVLVAPIALLVALTGCSSYPLRSPASAPGSYSNCNEHYEAIRQDAIWKKRLLYSDPNPRGEMLRKLMASLENAFHCDPQSDLQFAQEMERVTQERQKSNVANLSAQLEKIAVYRPPLRELQLLEVQSKRAKIEPTLSAGAKEEFIRRGQTSAQDRKAACTAVDVRTPVLEKMNNQKDGPWCYAYAASDLLSVALGKRVSVFDLIHNYNSRLQSKVQQIVKHKTESELHGGSIDVAVKRALRKGLCLESDLPSLGLSDSNGKTLKGLVHLLDEKEVTTDESSDDMKLIRGLFPNVGDEEFDHIMKKSGRLNRVGRLVNASCKERLDLKSDVSILQVDLKKDLKNDGNALMQAIDSELNQGLVVGVSYYASVLHDAYLPLENNKSYHASSVVARKWDDQAQSCNYLIRNSWGTACAEYDPGLACENGNIWVPADLLSQYVYSITTLH